MQHFSAAKCIAIVKGFKREFYCLHYTFEKFYLLLARALLRRNKVHTQRFKFENKVVCFVALDCFPVNPEISYHSKQ